jgi:hypothetical protein
MDRSVAQQLSHWARIGREVEAGSTLAARRRAMEAVLQGKADYDDLPEGAQAQVRAEWSTAIDRRVEELDVGAGKREAGQSSVALDDDGNLVRHLPDGGVEVM